MGAKGEYLEAKWKYIIDEQIQSGKTGRSWCIENEVSYDQFKYWQKKFREKQLPAALEQLKEMHSGQDDSTDNARDSLPAVNESGFIELTPEAVNRAPSNAIDFHIPAAVIKKGGVTVDILKDSSPAVIRNILQVMLYV